MALMRGLNTAVSGIQSHGIWVDGIGNNLANVNTTAFKAGDTLFQNLFSQTLSFGSAARANNGGINPKQVGLGVEVAQIRNNWQQGAIDTTGIPSDLAIEGEGFFILTDNDGSPVYSRDGAFARNIENKLVNPATGYFVRGWNADTTNTVNGDFQIMAGGALEDIEIPVGELRLAQATQNVQFNGNFDSDGNPLADEGSQITSTQLYILGTNEAASTQTDLRFVSLASNSTAPLVATSNGVGVGGGTIAAYTAGTSATVTAGLGLAAGTTYSLHIGKGAGINQTISFDGAAYTNGTGVIDLTHTSVSGDVTAGAFTTAIDATTSIFSIQTLPTSAVNGNVYTPLEMEARKGGASLQILEGITAKDMIFTYNTTGTTVQDYMNWMERTLGIDSSAGETVLSGGIAAAGNSTDDIVLDDETAASFETTIGESATAGQALSSINDRFVVKVVSGTGSGQSTVIDPSTDYTAATNTIAFTGADWATALDATSRIVIQRMTSPHDGRFSADQVVGGTKTTEFITTALIPSTDPNHNTQVQVDPTVLQASVNAGTINVGDIVRFTGDSGAVQSKMAIITDINFQSGRISFSTNGAAPAQTVNGLKDSIGAEITPPLGARFDILKPTGVNFSDDGIIRIEGNQGKFNDITDLTIKDNNETTLMQFTQDNNAEGESGRTTFTAYDSEGNPKEVTVTWYLEGRTDSTTSLRWIAESPNDTDLNSSVTGNSTGGTISADNGRIIGSGRMVTDSNGMFTSVEPTGSNTVVIDTVASGAGASLTFTLDFSSITTLSNGVTDINMQSQDGFPEGVLDSFSVGVDGTVTGIFSNGLTRSIAQVALARFNNVQGMIDLGDNLWQVGPNSGGPQIGIAGTDGRGIIRGGALEGSNVDLSLEFTNLIEAQRGFQSNARMVSTIDELIQELVNLRR